jgi:hypothetical protein
MYLVGKGFICRNDKHVLHIGEVTGKLDNGFYVVAICGIDGIRRYEEVMDMRSATYPSTKLGHFFFFPSLTAAIAAADIPGRMFDPASLKEKA